MFLDNEGGETFPLVNETAELYIPSTSSALATGCPLGAAGTDTGGYAFILIAALDIASGSQSVAVLQAANAKVVLAQFEQGLAERLPSAMLREFAALARARNNGLRAEEVVCQSYDRE